MATNIEDFDYFLPKELIAQQSVEPRDHSRLLVLNSRNGKIDHKKFFELPNFLHEGDVLVVNKTKVFKARLRGKCGSREVEVFLLRPKNDLWEVLIKPGRHVGVGDVIQLENFIAEVVEKDDVYRVKFNISNDELLSFADKSGEVPIPPYVQMPRTLDEYQTVYAKETGSVAAPTAGFHFTQDLIDSLKEKGIQFEEITLHVGLGTFRPVKTTTIEEHDMHSEFVQIEPEVAKRLLSAKTEGRRAIAVGTTTVRALEGSQFNSDGFSGDVNLFIKPGFEFKIIDGLITNFHLPKSTLLILVSAFAGRENILSAYKKAVGMKYRFFSFGDAMFIHRT